MRALLDLGLGKDLSAELSTPAHRSAMEQLLQHHKLGKYLANQSASEEKVRQTKKLSTESFYSPPHKTPCRLPRRVPHA